MIQDDTIKLLRECDAGVKMGYASINDVLDRVHSDKFRSILAQSRSEHQTLEDEIRQLLDRYQDDGKDPNAAAKGFAHIKTEWKLAIDASDETIADLMSDGCGMGVKSIARYLNQYKAADEVSKNFAKRVLHLEEKLAQDIRPFL